MTGLNREVNRRRRMRFIGAAVALAAVYGACRGFIPPGLDDPVLIVVCVGVVALVAFGLTGLDDRMDGR